MKEHKIKQWLYHKTNSLDDTLDKLDYRVEELGEKETVKWILGYFRNEKVETLFPAKSYAVAIIYAKLLEKHYKEDFWTSLKDPDLFLGTDRFFRPYGSGDTVDSIYNSVLRCLSLNEVCFEDSKLAHVKKTVEYFKLEFLPKH